MRRSRAQVTCATCLHEEADDVDRVDRPKLMSRLKGGVAEAGLPNFSRDGVVTSDAGDDGDDDDDGQASPRWLGW